MTDQRLINIKEIISGAQGRAIATIDGRVEELFYLKKIKATAKKTKNEIKTLGRTGSLHKATGFTGTGDMTMYYTTSLFRELMLEYIKTGKDFYFDILVENDDKGTSLGKQTVILKEVNLDEAVMAMLDVDSTELEEDVSFTWHDADMPNLFAA